MILPKRFGADGLRPISGPFHRMSSPPDAAPFRQERGVRFLPVSILLDQSFAGMLSLGTLTQAGAHRRIGPVLPASTAAGHFTPVVIVCFRAEPTADKTQRHHCPRSPSRKSGTGRLAVCREPARSGVLHRASETGLSGAPAAAGIDHTGGEGKDMDLDVQLDGRSLGINIADPYRPDMVAITRRIGEFLDGQGVSSREIDIAGLLPRMIRGVAGCEDGCPANAKDLVERGYGAFALQYVEGGILTASSTTADGKQVTLKVFPDF